MKYHVKFFSLKHGWFEIYEKNYKSQISVAFAQNVTFLHMNWLKYQPKY